MCFVTCGSMAFSMEPIIFLTDGLNDFIEQVFHIDNQDFVVQMEGFAVQGLKGTLIVHIQTYYIRSNCAHNLGVGKSHTKLTELQSAVHNVIDQKLGE